MATYEGSICPCGVKEVCDCVHRYDQPIDMTVDRVPPPVLPEKDTKKQSDGSYTDYYKLPEDARDLIDLIEHKNMSFSIGNIFKACYRLGEKHGIDAMYDLNKIIFFAERMKKQIEKNK